MINMHADTSKNININQVISSQETSNTSPKEKVVVGSVTNVPHGKLLALKDSNGNVTSKLKNGTVITVHSENKNTGRVKISHKGNVGTVSAKYINIPNQIGVNENNQNPNNRYYTGSQEVNKSQTYQQVNNQQTTSYTVVDTNGLGLNIRSGAGTNYNIVGEVSQGGSVEVLDRGQYWSKVLYNGQVAYVATAYIYNGQGSNNQDESSNQVSNSQVGNQGNSISVSSSQQGNLALDNNGDNNYTPHTLTHLQNNPSQTKYLLINKYRGINVNKLANLLQGKGVLSGKADVIASACKKYNIDPVYFLSQTVYEGGWGTSELAEGVQYNGETVYDLFGIGAYDSNPMNGATYAYNHGWDSVDEAIYGAAQFLSTQYLNNKTYNQNTPYRLIHVPNQNYAWHSYCTGDYYANYLSQLMNQFSYLYNSNDTFEYSN